MVVAVAAPVITPVAALDVDVATATTDADHPEVGPARAAGPDPTACGGARWVWAPDDDAACLDALLARHDLCAGVVVCHPRPGATWTVLVEDLLRAVGKHPRALARERRRNHGERLLEVWLRAELVRHLVVLRAHRLDPPIHERLAGLATATDVALWLGWHHRDPPAAPHPTVSWADAAHALAGQTPSRARGSQRRRRLRGRSR